MLTDKAADRFAHLKPGDPWPKDCLEWIEHCPVCGGTKRTRLYHDLVDRIYTAPGRWTLYCCDTCGSGYLDPRPSRETIAVAYRDYITHELPRTDLQGATRLKRLRVAIRNGYLNQKFGYRLEPHFDWGFYAVYLLPPPLRLEWDRFARHLPTPASDRNRLLDVGCGNGDFAARARDAGWAVTGLDFDSQAAACAKARGIEVFVGDYSDAPFDFESFDVITADQVIEHVHDPLHFLKVLAGWLRPGGRLWIGTPNIAALLHRWYGRNYVLLHPPVHLVLFTPSSLHTILKRAGFAMPRFMKGGYYAHVVRQSANIRDGCHPYADNRSSFSTWAQELWHEWLCWIFPGFSADLVVAHKGEKNSRGV